MKLTVNGEEWTLDEKATLDALLKNLKFQGNVAVAVNMTFVPRSAYATTELHDGDAVEIVEPRQGG
jgi:sulfur carrier protein